MRGLRLRPLVLIAAVGGVAASAALAAGRSPAANPSFTLVQITKADCPAPKVILGRGCWDKSGQILSANWSVNDGNATWDTSGWTTTYKWTLPATIPPTGAGIKLEVTAVSKSGQVCPAMGPHTSFPLKDPKQDPQLGVCAKPNEGTATASKTVNVLTTSSGPGSITIGLQDGPQLTYKYIANPTRVCRKFGSSAATAMEPPYIVGFDSHTRGVPDRGESPTLADSLSSASGRLSICDKLEARGALASDATGTVHHRDRHVLGKLVRTENLVLAVKRGAYNKTRNWQKVALVVAVTQSDDRDCRVGAEGRLTLTEDLLGDDEFWLRLCGSNHTHRFKDRGAVQVDVNIFIAGS